MRKGPRGASASATSLCLSGFHERFHHSASNVYHIEKIAPVVPPSTFRSAPLM